MNSGLTEVVLLRFKALPSAQDNSRLAVKVHLSYYALERRKPVEETRESFITVREGPPDNTLPDREVGKNFSIALLAQAIRDMAVACEAQRYEDAEHLLTAAIAQTYQRYPHLEDE